MSRSDWESNHAKTDLDYQPMGQGYDNKYGVMFQVGNVWFIERQWGNNRADMDAVEIESKGLIPSDSDYIETYSPEGSPEIIVNLYHSESLKDRFKDEDSFSGWWTGGEPGDFTIIYNVYDGLVGRMIIATGNNP